ncbi:FKBP-type peptidyl-prolyl cis-trans isomerase [Lysobacter sp. N42]|uniref:FKBP-type peptidyl-prolyl cis-trans isomerase n=1 Tax=Lysobacter sp. N42 TaxID=2545719 RepID=UPI001048547C|nr:FKBP-type peptidyl-prolyl cis-trans isomerase [Lysobacter sp. N42]TCZ88415.1 FKBP-type peptidyl-prolyl cis-trans isomerase [Lysobacter sp. N42]
MKLHTPLALATLASALVLAGCNQDNAAGKAADKPAADAKTADADAIPGLKDEKERISYMIGLDIGKTLEQVKDEVDVDTLEKALRTSLEGGKPLMTEEQAAKVREAFAQKIQAKRIAEQMQLASKNQKAGQEFLAANAKKPGVQTTPSGLQYQVITQGSGPKPKESDLVRVHYTGTLLDGTKFDSSVDRGQPAVIPLQQVVPGWREGIQLMPVGSKYRLWLPGNLAYGEAGTPGGPIGPNATLVFEVELLGIEKPGAGPAGPGR